MIQNLGKLRASQSAPYKFYENVFRSILVYFFAVLLYLAPNNEMVHADLVDEGSGQYRVEWTPRMAGKS